MDIGNMKHMNSIEDIEEDIKILEEFKTNGYNILLMKYGDRIKTNFKLAKAIEHILSDYKRVLKENEELRTEVNSLKEEKEQYKNDYFNLYEQNKQYIHYSKIEELAEKIHNELDKNGITRAYQIIIDSYFDEVLGG